MKKVSYHTTFKWGYDETNKGAHYKLPQKKKGANHGEFCESVSKFHRHQYTPVNPNTPYWKGSDIESIKASVKSSNASLGSFFGDATTISEAIKYYFKNDKSELYIWTMVNEATKLVNEYHMNKREFGQFINLFARCHVRTNSKGIKVIEIRLPYDKQELVKWFEENCAC